ncbi:hypothetical protein MicvaDRAFT_2227 [Microcoleus vaginatus FGP-2]|nr:hypothetical protein MicvaDRAFT_2227 [Microcoleus vaginatus FGP-2]
MGCHFPGKLQVVRSQSFPQVITQNSKLKTFK